MSHHPVSICLITAMSRKLKAATTDKIDAERQLDAKSVRLGDLRTEEARGSECPSSAKSRGRHKRGDVSASATLRMFYEDGDVLSGNQQSFSRRYDCAPQTIGRCRDQVSEAVLTQRDDSTYKLLDATADLIVPMLASHADAIVQQVRLVVLKFIHLNILLSCLYDGVLREYSRSSGR